jgi:hypothetical protein
MYGDLSASSYIYDEDTSDSTNCSHSSAPIDSQNHTHRLQDR